MAILGGILVAIPFLVLTGFMVAISGWRVAACVWGITGAVGATVAAGVFLMVTGA